MVAAGGAAAHTAERAFVLTLPTGLYVAGGTAVVAFTFGIAVALPGGLARRLADIGWPLGRAPGRLGAAASVAVLAVTVALIAAGFEGSTDPLANPLPLTVWTLGWVGLAAAHALFGDLWSACNPWRGAHEVLRRVPGVGRGIARPWLRYPARLGAWPAVAVFLGFAWFQLIHPAPQDPSVLAWVAAIYVVVTLAGTVVFGLEPWLRHGEAFSLFFRMVAWLAPLGRRQDDAEGRIVATLPGLGLLHLPALGPATVAFVLMALGAVSFDGLSATFWWLDRIGVNPLEFPGRSAVIMPNTAGLIGFVGLLAALVAAAVGLGRWLGGDSRPFGACLGAAVPALVPIAFGYHLAHHLPEFLVDVQYALQALNDPLGLGWDPLGIGGWHVTASFLNNSHDVRLIWHVQVATIVVAHVVAVVVGHVVAVRRTERRLAIVQAPMTLLMVGYTTFGLWLLAAPVAG